MVVSTIALLLLLGVIFMAYFLLKSDGNNSNDMTQQWSEVSRVTTNETDSLILSGRADEAIESWQAAVDNTDDVNKQALMYLELARVYSSTGDNQKYYEIFQIVDRLNSDIDSYLLYTGLADSAQEFGDYEQAEQYILKVLEYLETNPQKYGLEIRDYTEFLEKVRNEIS